MKLLSSVFILVAIYSAQCASEDDVVEASLDEQWRNYKMEFKRDYADDEDKVRFKLFVDTIDQIKDHNEKFTKGLVEVKAGLNEYSDWNDDEKQKLVQ